MEIKAQMEVLKEKADKNSSLESFDHELSAVKVVYLQPENN